jgi:hypothetical protein
VQQLFSARGKFPEHFFFSSNTTGISSIYTRYKRLKTFELIQLLPFNVISAKGNEERKSGRADRAQKSPDDVVRVCEAWSMFDVNF